MNFTRLLVLTLLLSPAAAARAEGLFDTAFGTDGYSMHGFLPGAAGGEFSDADVGVVACSGPQGSLVAAGLASFSTRIVTLWLTPQGLLDVRFSADGKESFALPAGTKHHVVGACQPDGKLLIAYNLLRSNDPVRPNHFINVVRIDPFSGLPDAGFGNGGTITIDLQLRAGGQGIVGQRPAGLSIGRNGDVVLVGNYSRETVDAVRGSSFRDHGFALRLSTNGSIAQTALSHTFDQAPTGYVAADVDADEQLRAVGTTADGNGFAGMAISHLDYTTLQEIATLQTDLPVEYRPLAARMLDADTLAIAAVREPGTPVLVLHRGTAQPLYFGDLPAPLDDEAARIVGGQIAPAPGGGLIFAARVALPNATFDNSAYFAKVLGVDADDRPVLDTRFGRGGSVTITREVPLACIGPPILSLARFTFWNGAIAGVGAMDAHCETPDIDIDYAVFRLEAAPLLRDGFETRPTWP